MADDQNIEQRIKIAVDTAEAANSIKELRGSIRQLQELQNIVGSESDEFVLLGQAAGEASLKIRETTAATKALAGTPLQQTAGSFGLIRENLEHMNFEGVARGVTLFAGSLNKLNPAGLMEGFAKLGESLMTLGKALLTNPIFLIGAAIALIIAKFDELKEMGGLVGKVFSGIGAAIHAVIKAITAFTDAIGLTDIAGQKAMERRLKGIKEEKEALEERFEFEKKAAELTKGNVELVEAKKLAAQKQSAKEIIAIYEHIKEEKGHLTEEELEKYKEALQEFKKIQDQEYLYVLEINKKILDGKEEAAKKIEQGAINAIKDETKRKRAQAAFDAAQEIKEVKNTERERFNVIEAARKEAIKGLKIGSAEYLKINHDAAEANKQIIEDTAKEEKNANDKKNREIAEANEAAEKKAEAAREKAKAKEEARVKKFEAEKEKDRKLDEKLGVEAREQAEKDKDKALKADEKRLSDLQKKTDQFLKDGLEQVAKNLKKEEELKKQTEQRTFAIAEAGANALSALNDLITQSENNHLKAGEKASIEMQKRQFARQKALGIIGAIINVAQGITAALSQAPPYSFIMAALTAVTGGLQIAKIASAKFNPESGGGGGDTSAPSVTAPSAATAPTLQSNFSAGQFFGAGTARAQKADSNSNGRVYVVESDITKTQSRVAVTQTRSTLSGRH